MKYMELLEQTESKNKVESVDKITQVNVFDYFSKKALAQTAHKYFESLDVSKLDETIKKQISSDLGIRVDALTKEHIFTSYIRSAIENNKEYTGNSSELIFAKIATKLNSLIIKKRGINQNLTYAEKRFFQSYILQEGKAAYNMEEKNTFQFCDAAIGAGTLGYYNTLKQNFNRSGSGNFRDYIRSQIVISEMRYEEYPPESQLYIELQKQYDLLDTEGKQETCTLYLKQNYPELSDHHIFAIMGNLFHESRFNTFIPGDKIGGVHTSDGLCQWHDPSLGKGRLTNLKSFAQERKVPWNYFGVQLDFLVHEIKTNTRFTPFLQKKSLYDATQFFVYVFESPTNKAYKFSHDRLPKAREYQKTGITKKLETLNLIAPPIQI